MGWKDNFEDQVYEPVLTTLRFLLIRPGFTLLVMGVGLFLGTLFHYFQPFLPWKATELSQAESIILWESPAFIVCVIASSIVNRQIRRHPSPDEAIVEYAKTLGIGSAELNELNLLLKGWLTSAHIAPSVASDNSGNTTAETDPRDGRRSL